MSKIFISLLLSVHMLISMLIPAANFVKAEEDKSDFDAVIRFSVVSDCHVKADGDTGCKRIIKALSLAKSDALSDTHYNGYDAAIFAGDLTDRGLKTQFNAFYNTVNDMLDSDTKLLAVHGKSHDCATYGKKSLSYLTSLSSLDSDWHFVINGFHFIGLSPSEAEGEHYGAYQKEWLTKQLDEAVADDSEKPVFVINHEHPSNTVYGSTDEDGWGIEFFKDVLEKYPQVVHFSGHSHYPLNDARSVWQGAFTAIGTGTLSYAEFTVDGERKVHPKQYKDAAQLWIVEVDSQNTVRLRGFDALSGKVLCEYYLNNIADVNARTFKPETVKEKSSAPIFSENAVIKYSLGKVKFSAAESTDGYPVFLYRANVYSKDGEMKKSEYLVNNYWKYDEYTMPEISITAAKGDTVEVIAENAYGMQSEAMRYTVK